MNDHGRTFAELSWLEIAHVLASLMGARVVVDYSAGYSCSVEYDYTTRDGVYCHTGLASRRDTAEESAEWLVRRVFEYMPFMGFPGLALPELRFTSKEDLALKLAAAGVDPEFSLTHRSG